MINNITWRTGLYFICTIALAIALSGIAWLPIEAHESFVLLAAQHMRDSGDWVIPYFNGEPHLTKPPLNYWLTMIISWLSNDGHVEAWHGRLPSVLAGLGIVITTAYAGKKLFDERIGLLAALITCTCTGYFYYTHSARPEMLYALCCNIAILAYLYIRESQESVSLTSRNILLIYILWLAFALATLCKGPHLPIILLIGFLIDQYWQGKTLKQSLILFRPVSGLILTVIIVMPWWWILHHRLGGNGLHGTQLSGSLLTLNLIKSFSLYYLYRPLQLLLPWIIFLPALSLAFKSSAYKKQIKLLVLLTVLPAILLSFGPQKRWYYMLPTLLPMSLILSTAMMLYLRNHPLNSMLRKSVVGVAIISAVAFIFVGQSKWGWSPERFDEEKLANIMNSSENLHTAAGSWDISPQIYTFYSGRVITSIRSNEQIQALLSSEKTLLLLIQTKNINQLSNNFQIQQIGHTQSGSEENQATTLLNLSLKN